MSLSTTWATLPRFWYVFMITFPTISGIGSHLPFDTRVFKQSFYMYRGKKHITFLFWALALSCCLHCFCLELSFLLCPNLWSIFMTILCALEKTRCFSLVKAQVSTAPWGPPGRLFRTYTWFLASDPLVCIELREEH